LSAAAEMLWRSGNGYVPVAVDDGNGLQLLGVLTDEDVSRAAMDGCRPLHAIRVMSAMRRDVWACRASDSVESAAVILRAHRLPQLAVLDDDGHLVGVITADALAAATPDADETSSYGDDTAAPAPARAA
jgi:CBS domain-containing protein